MRLKQFPATFAILIAVWELKLCSISQGKWKFRWAGQNRPKLTSSFKYNSEAVKATSVLLTSVVQDGRQF